MSATSGIAGPAGSAGSAALGSGVGAAACSAAGAGASGLASFFLHAAVEAIARTSNASVVFFMDSPFPTDLGHLGAHAPLLLIDRPAAWAEQAFAYVLPSHPQTGL